MFRGFFVHKCNTASCSGQPFDGADASVLYYPGKVGKPEILLGKYGFQDISGAGTLFTGDQGVWEQIFQNAGTLGKGKVPGTYGDVGFFAVGKEVIFFLGEGTLII